MRTIGVVTGSRADYGCYLPILRRIQASPSVQLHLLVAGMHLARAYGLTVEAIQADGFPIGERVDLLLCSDTPEGIGKSIGVGTIGFAQAYGRVRPDLLLVLGDRFEMHAAAVAALPFKIPVAHIHGGERTQGAIDDALRDCITRLSHLHFVSTQASAHRLTQMGEEAWRITVSGAPSLDNLRTMPVLDPEALSARYGVRLEPPPLLVTYHPVTLEYEQTEWQVRELLEALRACGLPVLFTAPNADTSGGIVRSLIEQFVSGHPQSQLVTSVGTQGYLSLLSHAAAMVGNSSSGIIEAPSVGLPVVNIGTRQEGRVRAGNVIDVGYRREEILAGIRKAVAPEFRASVHGRPNPYGNGGASEIIVRCLEAVPLDDRLITKRVACATAHGDGAARVSASSPVESHG